MPGFRPANADYGIGATPEFSPEPSDSMYLAKGLAV